MRVTKKSDGHVHLQKMMTSKIVTKKNQIKEKRMVILPALLSESESWVLSRRNSKIRNMRKKRLAKNIGRRTIIDAGMNCQGEENKVAKTYTVSTRIDANVILKKNVT